MAELSIKNFSISIGADKEYLFIDRVEKLCKDYSGSAFAFGYDVEDDGDEDCPCISLWFNYFDIRIDEDDDEAFVDLLESICREFAGNSFHFEA